MTAFALKIIASLCMLVDHIGAVIPSPYILRLIGRISFPIYAYLIAQGCKYTKDINRYLLRLGLFALISEIPFDVAFMHYETSEGLNLNINFLDSTNVFYTLFFGVACIILYERVKRKRRPWVVLILSLWIPIGFIPDFLPQEIKGSYLIMLLGFFAYIAAALWLCKSLPELEPDAESKLPRKLLAILSTVPLFLLGSVMGTDYGMWGILYILFFYLMKPGNRVTRTVAMFSVVFLLYAYPYVYTLFDENGISIFRLPGQIMQYTYDLYEFFFALIAVILIFLYNGKRGPKVKWSFYVFYPAHIAVLAAVWFFFIRV